MSRPDGSDRWDASESILTVAFVDVEGSTALVEQLGDRVGTEAVNRQLQRVREHLTDHDGREVKALGDGLLATFNSPRRAVAWAVACQHSLEGHTPPVRIGINAGEVVDRDGDPLGAAVNAAARITDRAAGGEVMVADVVRQLVGSSVPGVAFTDRGRLRLKGFTDRWHLWAVDSRAPAPRQATTVGRGSELDVIAQLVADTINGNGSAIVFEGEAGIGKTHLVASLRHCASDAGLTVIEAAADEVTRRPGLLAHAVAMHSAVATHPRRRLKALLDGDSGEGNAPADLSFAVVEATLEAVELTAGRSPLLIVLEDAHWADDLSLAILRGMVRELPATGVSVVTTLRPTPRPELLDRAIEARDRERGAHLQLEPLDDADISGLAAELVGALPGPNLRVMLDATGGNPLFVSELLRSADDEGLLHIEAGLAEVASTDLPRSLHETLTRRLSWLAPETRELLRLASLLGTHFTLAELSALSNTSVIDVAAQLREASLAGLLVGDGDRLAFRHDLVREAVYGSMLPAERRDLHRVAGQALARTGAPTAAVANQFARGAEKGDLEALAWLDRAATEAVSVAPSAACELFEQAVSIAPDGWTGLGELQVRMIEPLAWCGRFARAEELTASVLATSPDPAVRFAVVRGMSAIDGNRGRIAEAIRHIATAAAIEGAPPDEVERLVCFSTQLEMLSGTIFWRDTAGMAEATLERARATGDVTTQCVAHQVISVAHAVAGFGDRALAASEAAVHLLENSHVQQASYIIPDAFHAGSLFYMGRIDEALVATERAHRRHVLSGALTQLPLLHMIAAMLHHDTGQWDDCMADVEAGQKVAADTESYNFVLYFHAIRAGIAIHRGDLGTAETELAMGTTLLAGGSLFGADWLFDAQVDLLVARGDIDAAINVAELCWTQTEALRHFYGSEARAIATTRLAVRAGRRELAEAAATAATEGAERTSALSAHTTALHCSGLLAGDPEPLLEAARLLRDSPFTPQLAEACEDAAALLVRDRRGAKQAVALLDETTTILGDLGAEGDLERVRALQQTAGASNPRRRREPRPTFGWEALTPTELIVSRLVAEGLTNPDIGERLSISRRTVETHVAHIFRKLDVASRTQLATEVVRRGIAAQDP